MTVTGDPPTGADAWFDRAAAEQDFALPFRYAAQNQERILVVNHAAARANEARQMVPGGDFDFDG